ncbi:MAG: hypothetical protein QXE64_00785 [Candidatus Pacearchaeota archaeon]
MKKIKKTIRKATAIFATLYMLLMPVYAYSKNETKSKEEKVEIMPDLCLYCAFILGRNWNQLYEEKQDKDKSENIKFLYNYFNEHPLTRKSLLAGMLFGKEDKESYKKGLSMIEDIINEIKRYKNDDWFWEKEMIFFLKQEANAYLNLENPDNAKKAIEEALKLAERMGDSNRYEASFRDAIKRELELLLELIKLIKKSKNPIKNNF